jgi:hypothetical protein
MAFMKSSNAVDKNRTIWSENIVSFKNAMKLRNGLPAVDRMLCQCNKMPKESDILGRFFFLANEIKSHDERFKVIKNELQLLWEKFNFPCQSERTIMRKIATVVSQFHKYQKRPSDHVSLYFSKLFDITNGNGAWLNVEDKRFHDLQVSSGGSKGYSTEKQAPKHSIHPSKRMRSQSTSSFQPTTSFINMSSSTDSSQVSSDEDSWHPNQCSLPQKGRCRHSTKSAVRLVTKAHLSTHNASKVLKILDDDGYTVPLPSQSGVHKALYKEAKLLSQHFRECLKSDEWCLHFDGKHLDGEKQVVVLKNKLHEIRLAVLSLENGKANTISAGIIAVIIQYDLGSSIKIIICDTTSTNTGSRNGVVVQLQTYFQRNYEHTPQYIGCQQHILDRVLRVVMDSVFHCSSTSPNISYPFVDQVVNNYEDLKNQFNSKKCRPHLQNEGVGWRDDMKFLYHLSQAFIFFEEHKDFPFIKFQSLPGMSNARWNSRAILALLAFILIPGARNDQFTSLCRFIAIPWCSAWFCDQCDWKPATQYLLGALQKYPKAEQCFNKHWKKEDSAISGIERSNQCAERAIKSLQDIFPKCKSYDKLCERFLLTNDDHMLV